MKKFSIVRWVAEVGFVSLLGACSSESVIANSVDSVNSSSSEAIISSSSEEPPSSSSVQEPFNPGEYRTCDEKYEGKFLMYQYSEMLDIWNGTFTVQVDFYKCEKGKWSEPITNANPWMEKMGAEVIDRDVIDGDVIRVVPDGWQSNVDPEEWKCNAENEGQVQSWSHMVYAVPHSPMMTPVYYARCEQGDWILCDKPDTSSLEGYDRKWPKESYLNPDIDYGTMTDERDGKVYKTVEIGDQIWMAENLNYSDSAKTPSLKGGSWCYDNKAKNCDVAGRLYSWSAAIDSAGLYTDKSLTCGNGKTCTLPDTVYGICPPGWHLPNNTEWEALFTAVGGQSTANKVLKSQAGWGVHSDGTDDFGFSAFPAGSNSGDFVFAGDYAYFWSSTEFDSTGATVMELYDLYGYEEAYLGEIDKIFGFSVRCIKNN